MLIHNERQTNYATGVLALCVLIFLPWLYPSNAYGIGNQQKIEGLLLDFSLDTQAVLLGLGDTPNPIHQYSANGCVAFGRMHTGLGIEAINYQPATIGCWMFHRVDNSVSAGGWCSQWVIPGGTDYCLVDTGGGDDDDTNCENGSGDEGEEECDESPILLDLDRNGFHLSGGPATFDIDSDGQLESVTWVSPNTRDAFLYLDRNGNGIADSGLELFGNRTRLANGEFARHGYHALREFDRRENGGNRDRVIDSSDSIFADLRIWIDDNADGICEVHETMSAAEAGVLSLNLEFRRSRRTDSHGNRFRYISRGRIEVNGESKTMRTTDVFFRILAQ